MLQSLFLECSQFLGIKSASTLALPMSLSIAGLFGGMVHCTTMCSAALLSAACNKKSACSKPMSLFHIGRYLSYTLLTILTYHLFHFGFAWSPLRQFLSAGILFLAGFIFLGASIPFFKKIFPWLASLNFPLPSFMRVYFYKILQTTNHPFIRGFIIGFMPCGLLFSALLAAATAPTLVQALIAITAFIIGTLPSLFAVQSIGNFVQRKSQTQWHIIKQGLFTINAIGLMTASLYLAFKGF